MTDTLFTVSGFDITVTDVLLCLIFILLTIWAYIKFSSYKFYDSDEHTLNAAQHFGYKIRLAMSLLSLSVLFIIRILRFDFVLWDFNEFSIFISHIFEILSLFSVALLIDWLISHLFIKRKYKNREKPKTPASEVKTGTDLKATRLVRYIVYLYLGQVFLKRLDLDYIIFQREIKEELFTVHISDLVIAAMIMMSAKVVVWFFTQVTLYRMYKTKDMDEGTQYAINQIFTYLIYIIATLFALDRIMSDMRIIYGASAALLVGMGMGLKQTFNDFFSGLIILFERNIKIGDVLEFDSQIGKVTHIGLRTSRIKTDKNISVLIPNSMLVNQSVSNWTHFDDLVRFSINVTVVQQSNAELVKSLLKQATDNIQAIKKNPEPWAGIKEFDDKNLVFTLYYYTSRVLIIDDIQSQIRFNILDLFQKNNIQLSGFSASDPELPSIQNT